MGFGLGLVLFIGAGIRSIMTGCTADRITAIRIAMLRLRVIVVFTNLFARHVMIGSATDLRLGIWIIRHLRIIGVRWHLRLLVLIVLGVVALFRLLLHLRV